MYNIFNKRSLSEKYNIRCSGPILDFKNALDQPGPDLFRRV